MVFEVQKLMPRPQHRQHSRFLLSSSTATGLGHVGYVPGELVGGWLHSSRSHGAEGILVHGYFCTDMAPTLAEIDRYTYVTRWSREKAVLKNPFGHIKKCLRWYGRTVTVPEVAGRPGGAGREQETRTRTERRRCTAGRWPRAPGDQPDGRRHGRRAYPTAGQEHGTAPPHPGGARVGAAGAPARRLCTPCPGSYLEP